MNILETESGIKLIVAGGRDFNDKQRMSEILDAWVANYGRTGFSVVSGMARGADLLAWEYCRRNRVKCYEFPADWGQHGKAAGHIRNAEMARFADILIAFWDGESKGTKNMIQVMGREGKPVLIEEYVKRRCGE